MAPPGGAGHPGPWRPHGQQRAGRCALAGLGVGRQLQGQATASNQLQWAGLEPELRPTSWTTRAGPEGSERLAGQLASRGYTASSLLPTACGVLLAPGQKKPRLAQHSAWQQT